MPDRHAQPGHNRATPGACAWALIFALVSTYWGLGGRVGVDQLALSIREAVRDNDTSFQVQNWIGVAAKLTWAGIAWLMVRRVTRYRRVILVIAWAASIALILYGLIGMVEKALMVSGVIDVAASIGDNAVIWYLLLWDPWWLLGGILFTVATWSYQREIR
jgi:hypothetical protein